MIFSKNYFSAIFTLVGTVIGAGIFTLPLLVNSSGVIPFLLFVIGLGTLQYFFNKIYAVIVLSSKEDHRIPGHVGTYAGEKWKKISSVICLAGGYGSLLAYLILGGVFLHGLLAQFFGGEVAVYSLALFGIESLIVFFGLKSIARAETAMSVMLLIVVGAIVAICFSNFDPVNIKLSAWQFAFLLYGPVFFSLGGDAAIPEVCKLLGKEKKKIKSAIFWGSFIPVVVTVAFVIAVVGATGAQTTADTLTGLQNVFDGKIIYLALLFGLLNIATSFFTTLQAVREIYWWDFRLNKNLAWVLAAAVPLVLFLLGMRNITAVVSITGAITGGAIGVIMLYLSRRATAAPQKQPPFKIKISSWAAATLSIFFILGLAYELAAVFDLI